MTLGEMIIAGLIAINICWSELLCRKTNRVLKTLFQMKYKKAIPQAEEEESK